jgi:hypothetical protein
MLTTRQLLANGANRSLLALRPSSTPREYQSGRREITRLRGRSRSVEFRAPAALVEEKVVIGTNGPLLTTRGAPSELRLLMIVSKIRKNFSANIDQLLL